MRVHNTFLTKTNKNYKYSLLPRALLFFFFFFFEVPFHAGMLQFEDFVHYFIIQRYVRKMSSNDF